MPANPAERAAPVPLRTRREGGEALAAAHQLARPSEPILVDVTLETGPNLAYTTNEAYLDGKLPLSEALRELVRVTADGMRP